jgi:hypothetical protein
MQAIRRLQLTDQSQLTSYSNQSQRSRNYGEKINGKTITLHVILNLLHENKPAMLLNRGRKSIIFSVSISHLEF